MIVSEFRFVGLTRYRKLYKNNQQAGGLIARLPAFILYKYDFFCCGNIDKILVIIKNPPTTNRDIVVNWVKIENKKKFPNEMEESTENDGEIIEICKKSPMADKYVRNDLGKY